MATKTQSSFDVAIYNALPKLDAATAALAKLKTQFDKFVKEACGLLADTALKNGELGAFLLHRHWNLQAGRLMVERPRVLQSGRVALVTAATDSPSAIASGVMPSRWAAPDARQAMVPLEFSSDPFVLEVNGVLAKLPRLPTSLVKILHQHKLQNTIGFMVIPRKSLDLRDFEDLVETNDEDISIVVGERLSPLDKLNRIKTGWPLSWTRTGSVWRCCYCSHGPGHTCKHKLPDPPICRPHGCV
jgi:hypothetical protein